MAEEKWRLQEETRELLFCLRDFFYFFFILDLREGDKGGGLCGGW